MVIPFHVLCKTATLPHVAPATAAVAFDLGDVSPYDVHADRIGSDSIVIVVCRWAVASIGFKFSFQLCTTAGGSVVF